MKKAYISPTCKAMSIQVQPIMNVSASGGPEIGNGGAGDGRDPDVRGQYDLFDDF